jgi:hypothetical protein
MSRLKKVLKRATVGSLLVISVLVLAFAFFNWRASQLVKSKLAPLLDAGKPTSLTDLQQEPVIDENNAAKVVAEQAESLRTFDGYLAKAQSDTEDDSEAQQTQAAIQVARRVAEEFPNLNQTLRAASKLPAYQIDVDYTSDPTSLVDRMCNLEVSPRTIVRALYGHGLMSLADGKSDEAIQDAIAILNWSRHVADQPLLINYLIATACYGIGIDLSTRCLMADGVTPDDRVALLNSLSSESTLRDHFDRAFDTERAFGVSSFASFPGSRFRYMLGELGAFLDTSAEFESFARQPTGLAPKQPTKQSLFGDVSWVSQRQALVAFRRNQALTRAVRILATWKSTGQRAEANLSDLALSEPVTTDPFTGSPMRFKVSGNAIFVYSVGENLIDDNGEIINGADIGIQATESDRGTESDEGTGSL